MLRIIRGDQTIKVGSVGVFGHLIEELKNIGLFNLQLAKKWPSDSDPLIALNSFDPFFKVGRITDISVLRPLALWKPQLCCLTTYLRCFTHQHAIPINTDADILVINRTDGRRNIPNLNEIVDEISDFGCAAIQQPESLSFCSQVDLFRHSKVVIAQHGSALANLIWCADMDNPPAVIEIVPTELSQGWHYEIVSNALGLRYIRVAQQTTTSAIDVNQIVTAIQQFDIF